MLELFLSFLKIGVVSFGGGYGMISILTDEVLSHGWLTESELLNLIAVSESTPGPIAINMATFIGSSQGGILGALLATLGVVLPAFIIILVIASLITGLLKFAGVKAVLNGIRPTVMGLIVGTGITITLSVILNLKAVKDGVFFDWRALVIFVLTALTYFIYKKLRKKNISVIILILLAAFWGIVFYGFLGGI